MKKHVLVVASTFPASDTDHAPDFVKEQVISMKDQYPDLRFSVLAPHNARSHTRSFKTTEHYDEYRFHYFWPFSLEVLAGRGIMPALRQNKVLYLQTPFLAFFELVALFRLVRKLKPDVIYAHWFMPQAIAAAFVSKITRTPFVFTSHSSDMQIMKIIPFSKPLTNFVMRNVTKWTVVSGKTLAKTEPLFSAKEWREYAKKLDVIPMGVHVGDYTKSTRQDIEPDNRRLREIAESGGDMVFFIGRLAQIKGVDLLIRAFSQLKAQNCNLVIAGDGQERKNLETLTRDLGVADSVHFVGYVSGQDKKYLYEVARVMVVSSIKDSRGHTEGLPVVLMEGLAAGKIIVASDVSGGEIVIKDGSNGLLFTSGSAEGLALKLSQATKMTVGQREKMTTSAQKKSLEYDWETIAKKHYEFLFNDV